jgi:hypothetical protein
MLQLAYNTTDAPVLADDLGHVIGGRDWGTVDSTDAASKLALGTDSLVLVDEDSIGKDANPAAVAAVERLTERRKRHDAATATQKDKLAEALEDAGVDVDDDATKAELVEAAESSDVKLTAPRKPAAKSSSARAKKS